MTVSLDQLRIDIRRLEQRHVLQGQRDVVATGIQELDRALDGGLARGVTTQLIGVRGSGRTTIISAAAMAVAKQRQLAAILDLDGDFDPRCVSGLDEAATHIWIVRVKERYDALWAADMLLRSDCFDLVALDGTIGNEQRALARLARMAERAHAIFVLSTDGPRQNAPGSVVVALRPGEISWDAGLLGSAGLREAAFSLSVAKRCEDAITISKEVPRTGRLRRHPELPDRRPRPGERTSVCDPV